MHKKITALLLSIQFLPFSAFSQNLSRAQQAQMLLEKPSITYQSLSQESGAAPFTLYAMAASAGMISQMPKSTLEQTTNKILEIMQYLQRHNAVYDANPALKRKLSEAFFELRSMYTYEYMRNPLKHDALPSMVTNDFVFVLKKLKYPQGNEELKTLVKEFDNIVRRKKPSSSKAGIALMLAGGIIGLSLLPEESVAAKSVSNDRAVFKRALQEAKQSSSKLFALTALELSGSNKRLTADIIGENDDYFTTLKREINLMTSQETANSVKEALALSKEEHLKKQEIKELVKKTDWDDFKNKYSFNPY